MGAVLVVAALVPLRLNLSLSVEGTLFVAVPGPVPLRRGAYVEHCLPEALARPILADGAPLPRCQDGGVRLLKRVGALPGDPVEREARRLRIPGQTLLFVAGAVPAVQPAVVPPGSLFLVGDTVRSFDSRYFGPVPRDACVHLLRIF